MSANLVYVPHAIFFGSSTKKRYHDRKPVMLSRDISISPSKITIIFGRAMSLVLFSIQYRSGYRDPVFTELKGGIMIF
jgi:hypothetical protein